MDNNNNSTNSAAGFTGAAYDPNGRTVYGNGAAPNTQAQIPTQDFDGTPKPPVWAPVNGWRDPAASYSSGNGTVPPADSTRSAAEPPKKKKSGNGKKWLMRIIAAVLVAAIGFGGGYCGSMLANKNTEQAAGQIVIQQVAPSTASIPAASSTSAEGIMTSDQIAEMASPSVVAIVTEQMTTSNYWFGNYVSSGAGSGVIMTADGYIVTNNHVIDGADTITVELHDGTEYPAELVGTYPSNDIAVIKIEPENDLIPAVFADSDALRQGAAVYAIGNPEGTFSNSITDGVISALDRNIKVSSGSSGNNDPYSYYFGGSRNSSYITLNVIQFSAAVSPGNSGGGLFTAKGELAGIVCAKSTDDNAEGLGFAIPSNRALEIATELIETGTYTGGGDAEDETVTKNSNDAVLGITVVTLTDEEAKQYGYTSGGVFVYSITEKSTMEAGLKTGDRIISVDSVMVSETTDVTGYLADFQPGDKVTLTVDRAGEMKSIEITLVKNSDKG